jgi:uncharacterized membrane protein
MKLNRQDSGLLRAVLCGLVGAAIVHICATLATPHLLGPNAYQRLAEHLPVNAIVNLGQPTARSQVLPYQEADMLLAVCRYDAGKEPVQVRAILPGSGWTLALYSPQGDNFYIVPGQDQKAVEVNAMLLTGGDDTVLPPVADPISSAGLTYVQLPASTGLMVIRAPLRGESYRAEAESVLARASCGMATRQPGRG